MIILPRRLFKFVYDLVHWTMYNVQLLLIGKLYYINDKQAQAKNPDTA